MAWTIALKYLTVMMRADNNGEGGILALLALALRETRAQLMLHTIARDLTLQASNASMSTEERQAMAAEIDTIRQGLISQSNTDYLGHPIFAPAADDPFSAPSGRP